MATYTITQTAGTEAQAEGAVLGIIGDIASIDGVGEPSVVVEEEGGTFLAVATITIPDDVQLDDVQKEKLSRYTNLDEKSEELETDFDQAENDDDIDLVAEAVGPVMVATMAERAENGALDTVSADQVEDNNSTAEDEIIVSETDIGDIIPEPAPEAADEFGAGLTAEAVEAREERQAEKEKQVANAPEAPSQKNSKDKPEEDLEPEVA